MNRPHCRCRKRRYPTRELAVTVALYQAGKTGTPLRVYRCPTSDRWHLTKHASAVGGGR